MGRMGISYLEVAQAASELQGKGINPTVDAIREFLGTGSRSTIGPYLKQWRNQQEHNIGQKGMPQELSSVVKGLYDRLQEEANAKVEIVERAAKEEISSIQLKLDHINANNASLEKELKNLKHKLLDILSENEKYKNDLEAERMRNASLIMKLEESESRVKDKVEQIILLEKQFDNTQANLEHYRDSVQKQREEEKRAKEREISLLNQEILNFKNQIISLNNRNTDLNQKLEATREENKKLEKEVFERKGKTMELQEKLNVQEFVLRDWENKFNLLSTKHEITNEELQKVQSKINQLEKNELVLKERISTNEKIIKRSEDTISNLQNDKLILTQETVKLKYNLKRLENII